jgi:hypothetical protein
MLVQSSIFHYGVGDMFTDSIYVAKTHGSYRWLLIGFEKKYSVSVQVDSWVVP